MWLNFGSRHDSGFRMFLEEDGYSVRGVAKDAKIKDRYGHTHFARWQWRAATDNRYQAPAV